MARKTKHVFNLGTGVCSWKGGMDCSHKLWEGRWRRGRKKFTNPRAARTWVRQQRMKDRIQRARA